MLAGRGQGEGLRTSHFVACFLLNSLMACKWMVIKMANKRLRAELLETAKALCDLDVLDAATLRDFNAAQLPPLTLYGAAEIKRLRLRAKASQAVFAAYLNTSVSTVQKWEIGDKKPSGPALKPLNMVERKGLKALV